MRQLIIFVCIYFLFVYCSDHHITVEVLKILTPKHIKILFHGLAVGDMAIFENKLKTWRLQSTDTETISTSPDNSQSTAQSFVKSPICSVNEMLMDTQNGRLILKHYSKHNILNEEQRNLLINTIAKYIESKGYLCSLSDCTEIENQICTIFPTESKASNILKCNICP